LSGPFPSKVRSSAKAESGGDAPRSKELIDNQSYHPREPRTAKAKVGEIGRV